MPTEFRRKLYKRGSSYETTIPMLLLFALDKDKKYKFVFDSAEKFLNEIIDEHKLDHSIIKGLMLHQQKFEDLFDALRRLIVSLQNRGMMSRAIQFENREKEIKPIIFSSIFFQKATTMDFKTIKKIGTKIGREDFKNPGASFKRLFISSSLISGAGSI